MQRGNGRLIALALALNAPALCAMLRINFVDSFGRPIPFKVEKFQACCLAPSRDYSEKFHGPVADDIPEIEFMYRLKPLDTRNFAVTEGRAEVT